MRPDPLDLAKPQDTHPVRAALTARVQDLNDRFRHHGATAVLKAVLRDRVAGRIALVSSFGAESVALLHLAALVDRHVPVLFLDTGLHFAETLVYQQDLAERLRLSNLRVLRATPARLAAEDPFGALKFNDPDRCCTLRKTEPLQAALAGFDAWITGRKRFQSAGRAALAFFEPDPASGRIKVNPLAHWRAADVQAYIDENRLPRHPLVARGYPSIGCAPCTSRIRAGEDARAGRWRGQAKTECGLHLPAPVSPLAPQTTGEPE